MHIEGWRSLVEESWGDYVILHNLPFSFPEPSKKETLVKEIKVSCNNLQKSAVDWDYFDFMEKLDR